MLTTIPTKAQTHRNLESYARAARAAGCPADQVRCFVQAHYVAQPKQLLFHAAARACDARGGPEEIGFGGARGPGKSHAMLAQIGLDDCQRQPGLKALLLRKVGKAVRESVEDMLPRVFAHVRHNYNRSTGTITFENTSRIIIGHFKDDRDVDAYLGLEYDVIGTEEATTLSARKDEMVGTCLRTSKPHWRPRRYSTTNPGGLGHAWYKKRFIDPFRNRRERDTRFIPATADDNLFLNPEYRQRLDKLVGWMLRAWRYGDWDIAAGQYFSAWSEQHHVIDWLAPPAHWSCWLALDYGFMHWTMVYLLAQNGDGRQFIADEHGARKVPPEIHCAGIDAMLARNGRTRDQMVTKVAGHDIFSRDQRGKLIADDYAAGGYEWERATIDRINGWAQLTRRLAEPPIRAPSMFISRRCTRLIECIPSLVHDPNNPEDVLKVDCDQDTGEGGDDPADAWRYGVMARPEAGWGTQALKALSGGRKL